MKWKVNFDINDVNFNLVGYCASSFIEYVPKKNGEQLFKEWYIVFENDHVVAYVPVETIKKVEQWIKEKVVNEAGWADSLHVRAEEYNTDYFNFAKSISEKDLSKFSNKELYETYKELRGKQFLGHAYAISTTWFLDSDGEVYSNFIREELDKYLCSIGVNDHIKVIEDFVLLTTPIKENFSQREQLDFLELMELMKSDVLENDKQLALEKHYKKWCWTPYGYIGPAYDINHYIEDLKNNAGVENIKELIKIERERNFNIKTTQEQLIKEIKLPESLQHYFAIARDIIYLKDYRKYCIWHGHYVLDKITKEISKRLTISHKQANYFTTEEVERALLKGIYDEGKLNERRKFCVIWANEHQQKIYYGDEATKIINNLDIVQEVVEVENGFVGTCAYPGKTRGSVKIVNSVLDIKKVEIGDIMVSLTTYPAFLSAMKKASAIITEDGGITCHAAIVARELKIPCVVGIKKLTKFLNDGDMIEVDANKGIVRKI